MGHREKNEDFLKPSMMLCQWIDDPSRFLHELYFTTADRKSKQCFYRSHLAAGRSFQI